MMEGKKVEKKERKSHTERTKRNNAERKRGCCVVSQGFDGNGCFLRQPLGAGGNDADNICMMGEKGI